METTKRCAKCETEKPLTAFARNASRKDGLQHRCRECVSATSKAKRPPKQEPNPRRSIEATQRWQAKNPERVKASAARYHQENKEKRCANARAWYAKNRARSLARQRNYQRTHSERACEQTARRRAASRGVHVERVDYAAILKRDGMVCHVCGGQIKKNDLHFDHVIPISKGGPHTAENIRPTHSRCNRVKWNKVSA